MLDTLWCGKIIIFFGASSPCCWGYYADSMAVRVYTARSVVMLESRQEQIVDFENVMSGLGFRRLLGIPILPHPSRQR